MFAWKQWSFFVPSFQAMSRDWIYYFYFVVSRLVVKRNCEPTVARRGVYWFRNLATVSYGSQRISFPNLLAVDGWFNIGFIFHGVCWLLMKPSVVSSTSSRSWSLDFNTRLFRENLLHEKLNNREEESRHKDEERHVPAHVHGLVPSQQLVYPLGTTVRQHFLSWDCSVVSRSWKRRCQHTITPSESFVKRLFHHQTGFWS